MKRKTAFIHPLPTLARPPRAIPLSTRVALFFGGTVSKFGWFVFALGVMIASCGGFNGDYSAPFVFRGKLETGAAVVTSAKPTHFVETIGKKHSPRRHRTKRIYAYDYKFSQNGADYEGTSYGTNSLAEGASVMVEFPVNRPDRSRICGMRRAPFSWSTGFVFIVPALGFMLITLGVLKGWKQMRLLASGEVAQGSLIKKESTHMVVGQTKFSQGGERVYKFTFQFTDSTGQQRHATVKTHKTQKLEDDDLELVLYDPQNPSRAVVLDSLPGKQGFSENGEVLPNRFWSVVRVTIVPLIAIAAAGLWLLWA